MADDYTDNRIVGFVFAMVAVAIIAIVIITAISDNRDRIDIHARLDALEAHPLTPAAGERRNDE